MKIDHCLIYLSCLFGIKIHSVFAESKKQFITQAFDQMLELGEDYPLYRAKEKIWVENPKIIKVQGSGSKLYLKPKAIGISKIKIDFKDQVILVVPSGFKESYKNWQKLSRKLPQIELGFCEQTICLKGEIFNLEQFIQIINLMDENKSFLFLKLKVSQTVEQKIQNWYSQYFRDHEITPPKIVFTSTPWKAIISSKDENTLNNTMAHQVGLFTQENKNKLDIQDNVKVSVQFVEVKKSFARRLGIQWPTDVGADIKQNSLDLEKNLKALLSAGESHGDAKTIANPNLVCRNGKEAEFLAGGEIPFKIAGFRAQNIVWKEYGIRLKIKPKIDPLGQMSLEIDTEVSTPDFSQSIEGLPTIRRNKVTSHFDLVKSKTIIISGLIQNSISNSKEGLAYLTQIPILGKLFSSQNFRDEQSELMIFMTPEIYE